MNTSISVPSPAILHEEKLWLICQRNFAYKLTNDIINSNPVTISSIYNISLVSMARHETKNSIIHAEICLRKSLANFDHSLCGQIIVNLINATNISTKRSYFCFVVLCAWTVWKSSWISHPALKKFIDYDQRDTVTNYKSIDVEFFPQCHDWRLTRHQKRMNNVFMFKRISLQPRQPRNVIVAVHALCNSYVRYLL